MGLISWIITDEGLFPTINKWPQLSPYIKFFDSSLWILSQTLKCILYNLTNVRNWLKYPESSMVAYWKTYNRSTSSDYWFQFCIVYIGLRTLIVFVIFHLTIQLFGLYVYFRLNVFSWIASFNLKSYCSYRALKVQINFRSNIEFII